MSDPHVGHIFEPCPHGIHTTKWPQGTNAIARCLVEHIIHRLVAALVDDSCGDRLCESVSDCLSSLLDVLDDSILMQLYLLRNSASRK
jgi:hypothetical protein